MSLTGIEAFEKRRTKKKNTKKILNWKISKEQLDKIVNETLIFPQHIIFKVKIILLSQIRKN